VIADQLGKQIYSSSDHFVHELLQNADDTFNSRGEAPMLNVYIIDGALVVVNNEDGFTLANFNGIVGVAESSKLNKAPQSGPMLGQELIADEDLLTLLEMREADYAARLGCEVKRNVQLPRNYSVAESSIGEKGLGFKSVVQNSDRVVIFSRGYFFQLFPSTESNPAGPFVPIYTTPDDLPASVRDIVKREYRADRGSVICALGMRKLHAQRQGFVSEQFPLAKDGLDILFLKHLRCVNLTTDNRHTYRIALEPATDSHPNVWTLKGFDNQEQSFLFSRFNAVVPDWLPRHSTRQSTHVNIQLAFSLNDRRGESKSAFAYLPMLHEELHLPFYVNADWLTGPSRESLATFDHPNEPKTAWNRFLLSMLPAALLVGWRTVFAPHPELCVHFFNFVPPPIAESRRLDAGYHGDKKRAIDEMFRLLQQERCVPTYSESGQAFLLPRHARLPSPEQLQIVADHPYALHTISAGLVVSECYQSSEYSMQVLKRLGAITCTSREMLNAITVICHKGQQPRDWYSLVDRYLAQQFTAKELIAYFAERRDCPLLWCERANRAVSLNVARMEPSCIDAEFLALTGLQLLTEQSSLLAKTLQVPRIDFVDLVEHLLPKLMPLSALPERRVLYLFGVLHKQFFELHRLRGVDEMASVGSRVQALTRPLACMLAADGSYVQPSEVRFCRTPEAAAVFRASFADVLLVAGALLDACSSDVLEFMGVAEVDWARALERALAERNYQFFADSLEHLPKGSHVLVDDAAPFLVAPSTRVVVAPVAHEEGWRELVNTEILFTHPIYSRVDNSARLRSLGCADATEHIARSLSLWMQRRHASDSASADKADAFERWMFGCYAMVANHAGAFLPASKIFPVMSSRGGGGAGVEWSSTARLYMPPDMRADLELPIFKGFIAGLLIIAPLDESGVGVLRKLSVQPWSQKEATELVKQHLRMTSSAADDMHLARVRYLHERQAALPSDAFVRCVSSLAGDSTKQHELKLSYIPRGWSLECVPVELWLVDIEYYARALGSSAEALFDSALSLPSPADLQRLVVMKNDVLQLLDSNFATYYHKHASELTFLPAKRVQVVHSGDAAAPCQFMVFSCV
jgi:hypothetical protein